MSDSSRNAASKKFEFKTQPYAKFAKLIKQGAERRVDPKELASEIRVSSVDTMPPEVADFLCKFLSGEIETRGRNGNTPLEKRLFGRHLHLLYRHFHAAVKGSSKALPEAQAFYEQHRKNLVGAYSPSEKAWRLVSITQYGNDGHFKRLQNLASEAKQSGTKNTSSQK